MSCCIENEGAKLKVKLTFEREQLLYDIKNNAYVESHVMAPETEHAKHMVADVGEEGNVDRVTRVLDWVSPCAGKYFTLGQRRKSSNSVLTTS